MSCSDDGAIKVWTPGIWSCVRSIETAHEGAVNALLQCKGRLASAGDDGVIKLWNASSWTCEVTVHHNVVGLARPQDRVAEEENNDEEAPLPLVGVLSLEMSGDRLVSGGDDGEVRVWNTSDWSCESLSSHQSEVWALLFTPDGALVTSSVNGIIRIWRQKTDEVASALTAEGANGGACSWECEYSGKK